MTQLSFGSVPRLLRHFTIVTLPGTCLWSEELDEDWRVWIQYYMYLNKLLAPVQKPIICDWCCSNSMCDQPLPWTTGWKTLQTFMWFFFFPVLLLLCVVRNQVSTLRKANLRLSLWFWCDHRISHRGSCNRAQCNIVCVSPPQVSAPVDYSNPPTVKNHNEVLRCFSLLGTKSSLVGACLHVPLLNLTAVASTLSPSKKICSGLSEVVG